MSPFSRPYLTLFAVSISFWAGTSSALAAFVKIKDPSNVQSTSIDFGVVGGASPYHTSTQYLEITHAGVDYRKVYIYTDNNAAFGVPRGGLVNLANGSSIPMVKQNFLTEPPSKSVNLSVSNVSEWPVIIDRSDPDFDAQKEIAARVTPGSENLSWVYLGMQVPLGVKVEGSYTTNIVFEDWSEAAEVSGPVVDFIPPQSLIVIPNEPVGFLLTLEEYSGLDTYAVHYKTGSDPAEAYQESVGSTPVQEGAVYKGEVELDPGYRLTAPGVLNYYFTAKDIFVNISETKLYSLYLVSQNGVASVPYSAAGGTVSVAVGDPRRPGVEVVFPSGSLRSDGTLTVGAKDPARYPPLSGNVAARVFEIGPENTDLLRPVSLSLPYLDLDKDGKEDKTGAKESDLRLYRHDGFVWRYVGGQVDTDGDRVRASVSRFGVYGVFSDGAPVTEDKVRPRERILTFNETNDSLNFNTTVAEGSFDIKIFDIRSNVVRELRNNPSWDGKDEGGNRVESGTYVYRFEGQGVVVTGMVAVAR
jgi:hypothetical protein